MTRRAVSTLVLAAALAGCSSAGSTSTGSHAPSSVTNDRPDRLSPAYLLAVKETGDDDPDSFTVNGWQLRIERYKASCGGSDENAAEVFEFAQREASKKHPGVALTVAANTVIDAVTPPPDAGCVVAVVGRLTNG